jgi:hypothetical protein
MDGMGVLDSIRKHIAETNSKRQLRQLTAKERTREKRLRRLLDRLGAGKDVARRDLENALTESEWAEYESFAAQEDIAKENSQRPKQFDRYVELLKKADFLYSRSLNTPTTKRSVRDERGRTGAVRLQHKAEHAYEAALAHLEELLASVDVVERAELLSWLDRDVDFGAGSNIAADAMLVPRLKNSKSRKSQSVYEADNIFVLRRSNKQTILQQALDSLIYEIEENQNNASDTDKLNNLLNITDI